MKKIIILFFLTIFFMQLNAISIPTLYTPTNGVTGQYPNVILDIYSVTGATSYDFQIDVNSGFTSPTDFNSASSQVTTANLLFGQLYYWRARAKNATETSDWTAAWSFTTTDKVYLYTPTNGTTGCYPNITIDWTSVDGITNYDYQIDITLDFNSAGLISGSTASGYSSFASSNLLFGTTYYWRVRSRHSLDISGWSDTWSFTTTDKVYLYTPTNGTTGCYPNITIDWTSVDGITNYDYQIDITPDFNSTGLVSGSTASGYSSFATSNLLFGTTYYWRVRSRHSLDISGWSDTWSFTTTDKVYLYIPTNGTTGCYPNITIDWTSVEGITNYDYQIDITPDFNSTGLVSGSTASGYSSFATSNLLFGTTYYWRVRSRHSLDISGWSDTWSFTTIDKVYLYTPTNGTTGCYPNITIDWTSVDGITNYDYQIDITPDFNSAGLVSGSTASGYSSFATSNLLFGTTYYWRVRSRHSLDISGWSDTWSFTTTDKVYLYTPTNGTTGCYPNITIDWTSVDGITNYDYQIDITPDFNSAGLVSGSTASGYSSFVTSNLLFGTTYYWRVRSRHSLDISGWSDTWSFTTTDKVYLYTPTNGLTGCYPNITIDWTSVDGITNYDYQIDITPDFNSAGLVSGSTASGYSSFVTSNLIFGTTYYWRVRSRHLLDISGWSDTWNFTTTNKVSLYTPYNSSTGVSINPTLDWYSIDGCTNYTYEYSSNPNLTNSVTATISSSSSQISLSSLEYGETYYWRVKAYHLFSSTQWSDVWSFTTVFQLATGPNLVSPSNNSQNVLPPVNFSWTSVIGATNYEIQFDISNTFSNPTTLNSTTLALNNVNFNLGTTYYWRARGSNLTGNSPWSSIWSFSTQTIVAPTLISPSNNSANQNFSLNLDWLDIPNVTNYTYQYSTDNTFTAYVENTVTSSNATISNLNLNAQYFWRVKVNVAGNISQWSDICNFTTQNILPPTLISPSNNSVNQFLTINFDWNTVSNATDYIFQIATDELFTSFTEYSTSNSNIEISSLNNETQYFWRVKSKISPFYSEWTNIWNFTTKSLPVSPILILPENQAINQNISLTLDWSDVSNIQNYEVQYSESETFGNYITSNTTSSEKIISGLNYFTTYYWRVRTYDGTDYSTWSEIRNFKTLLSSPILVSPSNNSENIDFENIVLQWNDVENASEYLYQYSVNIDFSTTNEGTVSNSELLIDLLNSNTLYYWRIKAIDNEYFSNWSEIWNFTTKQEVSISENKIKIKIFPNPAKDYITINCENYLNNNYNLIDLSGKILKSGKIENRNQLIDITNLNSGIYFVEIDRNIIKIEVIK